MRSGVVTPPAPPEFEAADAEHVRDSYRAAGVSFDHCWQATTYSRDNPTESY